MISGAIPGPGIILELLLDLAPYLFPILIGFYAERIFKTRLYGRVVDIVISLIGGLGLATVPLMIWSVYYNKLAENFYADLVKRGVDTTGQHPTTWFTESVRNVFCALAAILGALILLSTLHRPAFCRASRPKHFWSRAGTDLRNGTVGYDGALCHDGTTRQSGPGPF